MPLVQIRGMRADVSMMTPPHDSAYSWTRLGLTLAIAMVANVGMWAIIVIMPAVQAEFGVGRPRRACLIH